MELDSHIADWYDRNGPGENDHYSQPGIFYREALSPQDKKNLVSNIAGAMGGITGPKRGDIINRQLCHFFRADVGLGMAVAQALGINVEDAMKDVQHEAPVTA
jgi:catalase